MLNKADFYYFSPTGGTKKAGFLLAEAVAKEVNEINLCTAQPITEGICDTAIIAAPVFGGRIPSVVSKAVKAMNGSKKTVITMVVYGVRAYDDALLELNDAVTEAGFQIAASAAVIAQHSVVPIVGAGRPDEKDAAEIRAFAADVLKKLEGGMFSPITVPGNRPYMPEMNLPVSPICLPSCGGCGKCIKVCPVNAITKENDVITTDAQKCILCMACTAVCPAHARLLPPPVQESMNEKLGALKDVRRGNEFFI